MEQNRNASALTCTDEQAIPPPGGANEDPNSPPDEAQFATEAEARAWWDEVTHGLRCATGEIRREDDAPPAPRGPREEAADVLDPSGRRLRVDGWLPWKKARFLLVLVAGGVVADACRAVGMSVASAYALKNRRSGRAFGKMWDSLLIHRARSRLADNNLSRAMNGFVEQVLKDGAVVAERRRFDNRLSMAMLTRLDRLAESKSGEEWELLRALSEDFEDYLEVVEASGDEDSFLEARRPRPEEPRELTPSRAVNQLPRDELDDMASMAGTSSWRHVHPSEIPIGDLDPDRMDEWGLDGWIRAIRSYYLDWIELHGDGGQPMPPGREWPAIYDRVRRDNWAAIAARKASRDDGIPPPGDAKSEDPGQPSTSSTSPGPPDATGGGER